MMRFVRSIHAISTLDLVPFMPLLGRMVLVNQRCSASWLAESVPATGTVEVFGINQSLGDPRAARAAGVVGIYQELTIVPAMTALENVFLGQWRSKHGFAFKKGNGCRI